MLHLLPKLIKLDNDDVTAEERSEKPQMVQLATDQPSADPAQLSAAQPTAVASQPLPGANPTLEQVHQPAELQAALAMSPQVLLCMQSYLHPLSAQN